MQGWCRCFEALRNLPLNTYFWCVAKVQKKGMSTQQQTILKKYIDREWMEDPRVTADLWVYAADDALGMLVADMRKSSVYALVIAQVPSGGLFQKSLSEMRILLDSLGLPQREYANTHIVYGTPFYSVVPEPLFDSQQAVAMLSAVHDLPKLYSVKNDRSAESNHVTLYGVPDIFSSTLKVLFPHAEVKHYASPMLEACMELNNSRSTVLYVNMHVSYMDVVCLDKQTLRLVNTFPFEADTDIIYFLLAIAEQQKLQGDTLEVMMMGEVNPNSPLLQLLRKYIPHVHLLKRDEAFKYPVAFREFHDHQYFSLLSVLLCA